MKNIISILIVLAIVFTLSACEEVDTYDVAMITAFGGIDDQSFNQGTWEGIVEFCNDNKISYKYYQASEYTDAGYIETIDLVIEAGAKVVVTPGYIFEVAVFQAQSDYPDVKFILIDGIPHNADFSESITTSNTMSIVFSEQESGFLAGYAAVKDGYTKLGFTGGMALPSVTRFGVGYVSGAYYAAEQMSSVNIDFTDNEFKYFGDFAPTDNNKSLASAMYTSGVEVIFCAGGGAGLSVIQAAEESTTDKFVIGVDVDQTGLSDKVITSATKGLGTVVQYALQDYLDDKFEGGSVNVYGAADNSVGLPMETSTFKIFNQNDYDVVYYDISNGSIVVPTNYVTLKAYIEGLGEICNLTSGNVEPK